MPEETATQPAPTPQPKAKGEPFDCVKCNIRVEDRSRDGWQSPKGDWYCHKCRLEAELTRGKATAILRNLAKKGAPWTNQEVGEAMDAVILLYG